MLRISSVNAGYYDVGVEWLELAQAKLDTKREEVHLTPNMVDIKDRLREARQIHDHMLENR